MYIQHFQRLLCGVTVLSLIYLKVTSPNENATTSTGDRLFSTVKEKEIFSDPEVTQPSANSFMGNVPEAKRHNLEIKESSNHLSFDNKSDWYGTFEPYSLFAYSAYYIDESVYPGEPHRIVVIGVVDVMIYSLYCSYSVSGKQYMQVSKFYTVGGKFILNRKVFVAHCVLSTDITSIPERVSLMYKNTSKKALTIPVETPVKAASIPYRKDSMLICLKELYLPSYEMYPNINIINFIEWVELNRILGVDHISVYIQNTTSEMESVLIYYSNTGFLDLQSKQAEPGQDQINLKTPRRNLGIVDCLYRNIHAYDWVLMIDSDEYLMPKKEMSLKELVASVTSKRHKDVSYITFSNTVFFTDLVERIKDETELLTQQSLKHRKPEKLQRIKYMTNPRHCLLPFTHTCHVFNPTATKGGHRVMLQPSVAQNNHYKECKTSRQTLEFNMYKCTNMTEPLFFDDGALRYGRQLKSAVENVLMAMNVK